VQATVTLAAAIGRHVVSSSKGARENSPG